MYVYSLHFLPADASTIRLPPKDPAQLHVFHNTLAALGVQVKENIYKFLQDKSPLQVDVNSAALTMKKKLDSIDAALFPPSLKHLDNVTNFVMVGFSTVVEFRSLCKRFSRKRKRPNDAVGEEEKQDLVGNN
jgi:hypothetical protein